MAKDLQSELRKSFEWKTNKANREFIMPRKKTIGIIDDQSKSFFGWLMPVYNETTLLLMALTTILLFISDPVLRLDLEYFGSCFFPLVICGFFLSAIHPFLSRKKTYFEKAAMTIFVIVTNGGAGLYAGYIALFETDKRYLVFSIINILFFFFVSVSMAGGTMDKSISDENANLFDVIVSVVFLFVVFGLSRYFLKPHWSIEFSICVGLSTAVQNPLLKIANLIKTPPLKLNRY